VCKSDDDIEVLRKWLTSAVESGIVDRGTIKVLAGINDKHPQQPDQAPPTSQQPDQPAKASQYQPLWRYVTDVDAMKKRLRSAYQSGGDSMRYAAFLAHQLEGTDRFHPSNIKKSINALSVNHLISDIRGLCLAID
jgi:hypothetical protein